MSRRRRPDEDSTVEEVEEHTKRLKKQHDEEQKATLDKKSAAKTVVKDGTSLVVYQGQSSPARPLAQRGAPLTLAEPCNPRHLQEVQRSGKEGSEGAAPWGQEAAHSAGHGAETQGFHDARFHDARFQRGDRGGRGAVTLYRGLCQGHEQQPACHRVSKGHRDSQQPYRSGHDEEGAART